MEFSFSKNLLPIYVPVVPITPTFLPAASYMLLSIKEVLVLPFVPVRAIILSFSAGLPKKFALASASSILVFSTLSTIASEGSEISFSTANTRAPRE